MSNCTSGSKCIRQGIAVALVIAMLGLIIIIITGLLNQNFFPVPKENQIMITKSPIQIVYRGKSTEKIIDIVKELNKIPFEKYEFNPETEIHIVSEDSFDIPDSKDLPKNNYTKLPLDKTVEKDSKE